eukprot:745874-Hanusia_phi.AAC.2
MQSAASEEDEERTGTEDVARALVEPWRASVSSRLPSVATWWIRNRGGGPPDMSKGHRSASYAAAEKNSSDKPFKEDEKENVQDNGSHESHAVCTQGGTTKAGGGEMGPQLTSGSRGRESSWAMRYRSRCSIKLTSLSRSDWRKGDSRVVRWRTEGAPVHLVSVSLCLGTRTIHVFAASTHNVGKLICEMPSDVQAAGGFHLEVRAVVPSCEDVRANSQTFRVVDRPDRRIVDRKGSSSGLAKLWLTFPTREGWAWPTGTCYNISWQVVGVVQNVQIDILREGKVVFPVVSSVLNIGSYPFTIPLGAQTGEDFKIRVRSSNNKAIRWSAVDKRRP